MLTREFSSIANRVEALIPQAPRPTVLEHIRNAARTACEKTLAWRYVTPKYDLLPGVYEYAFPVASGVEVEHIFGASVNNRPLELANLDVAISRYPEWADLFSGLSAQEVWGDTPGGYLGGSEYNEQGYNGAADDPVLPAAATADGAVPQLITMVSPQRYVILPLPDAEETYEARLWLALKPGRDSTTMDTQAFNELENAFVWGALETLFAMPNKPWTNPDYAVHYGNKFREEYLEKKRRANLGHVRGSMSVRNANWL